MWEGVKGIQSRLSGQLYSVPVRALRSKTVGKRIFQDPESDQLPTLHVSLASLSTFSIYISTYVPKPKQIVCQKVKCTPAPVKPTVT